VPQCRRPLVTAVKTPPCLLRAIVNAHASVELDEEVVTPPDCERDGGQLKPRRACGHVCGPICGSMFKSCEEASASCALTWLSAEPVGSSRSAVDSGNARVLCGVLNARESCCVQK
jgi:hypothetical protein